MGEEKIAELHERTGAEENEIAGEAASRTEILQKLRSQQVEGLQRLTRREESGSFLQMRNPLKIAGDLNPVAYPVVNVNIDEPVFGALDEEIREERAKADNIALQTFQTSVAHAGTEAENFLV